MIFNKTRITVDRNQLLIKHTPIEFLLPLVMYSSSYVKQLYVRKADPNYELYGLHALLSDGREEKLLWDLDKNVLLFIEQEIERVLGIDDIHVDGEVLE